MKTSTLKPPTPKPRGSKVEKQAAVPMLTQAAKPKPKPRTRRANPKSRILNEENTLIEWKSRKAKICDPIHFLLVQKVIKSYESELVSIILNSDLLDLAKITQKKILLPQKVIKILETLDPSVPQELGCRYFMLHVNKSMISKQDLNIWLMVLSAVLGAESVISQVSNKYDFLVSKIGSALARILSECISKQWQALARSLGIPSDEIRSIKTKWSSADALREVIILWLQCNFKDANLLDLEKVLQQHTYWDEAKKLKQHKDTDWFWKEAKRIKRKMEEICAVELLYNSTNRVQITDQTMDIQLKEGDSTLLEVQIEGDPKGYVWYFNGSIIALEKHSIMSLCATDLTSEGCYRCKVGTYGDEKVVSKPIHVTINTSIDKHQQILIDRYTAQPEVPVDTWPPKGNVAFINLALIKQESIQKAGEYGRCTIRGDMDDIIKDKEGITYEEAVGNLSSGARVLIEGRPGSGKTTFVHKLSRDWANKEVTIRHVRLLFLIQLRCFSSDPNIGLRDIIGCYYRDCRGVQDIVGYADQHNGLGLGFLLDGLDEYLPRDRYAFIFRLIRKEALPKSVVIVASRPAAAADFRSIATRQIEVLGFLKPQIREYIDSYRFSADCKCQGLHKYLDAHPNVLHMCYLPIHISMVCFLYDMLAKDLPETETEIYSVFTKFAVLRMFYRYKSKSEVSLETLNDLSPLHKSRYLEVCKLAFEMTLSTKQVMRQAEVNSLLATIEEKELFGLITVDNIATICGFQDVYTFLHLTFQEFLAAYYISSLEGKYQMEMIKYHGKAMQMKQVWKFYCGLVKFDASGSKFKTLVSWAQHGVLYRIQCSFESQQPSTCDHVTQDSGLKFADCFLTSSDFTAMAFVISNTHQQYVLKVVLDKCTFGLEEVDILARKSNTKLSLITTLCYHGHDCTDAQLAILKELACSLSGLKVLDVTNTNFIERNFSVFVTDFKHTSLEILKVSVTHGYIPSLFYIMMAKAFFSQCSNFVNICFTGCDPEMVDATLLPYIFYCNFRKIDINFCRLKPIEFEVLSSDLQVNGERTTILSLTDCGIDDNAASCLARGIKNCTALEVLNLNCNFIGDDGAISLVDNDISSHNISLLNLSCNKIGNRGALAIASALKHKECSLHLWNNSLSNHESILAIMPKTDFRTLEVTRYVRCCSDLPSFCEGNEACKNLLALNLTGCTLTDKGVKALDESLQCCGNLKSFSYGSILMKTTESDLRMVLSALLHCKGLHNLSLTNMELNAGGLKMLANYLERTSLLKLNIIHSHIYDHAVQNILARPLESSTLCSLKISYCDIGNAGTAISQSIKFLSLHELDISSNGIQCEDAQALADGLKHCFHLAILNISHNRIEDDGTCSLAKALMHCTNLTKLNIGTNRIGDGGACGLANALVHCTKLTELNIGRSCIGDDGACFLAKALVHCTNLTELNIRTNYIGDDGACALAKALVHCTNLTELNISQNLIRSRGACSLANILVHLTNLTNLNISHNYIREKGASALANALEHCTNLNIIHDDFSACMGVNQLTT